MTVAMNVTKIQANSFIKSLITVFLLFIVIFVFLNNFQFKCQNKVPSVLGRLLRSVVYDSTFILIFPFSVNFSILSPNRVISANQGFYTFISVFICFVAVRRQIRLLSINTDILSNFLLVNSSFISLWIQGNLRGFEVYYQKLTVQFLFHQESIVCAFLQASATSFTLSFTERLECLLTHFSCILSFSYKMYILMIPK